MNGNAVVVGIGIPWSAGEFSAEAMKLRRPLDEEDGGFPGRSKRAVFARLTAGEEIKAMRRRPLSKWRARAEELG